MAKEDIGSRAISIEESMAIKKAKRIGRAIVIRYPEIADDYRNLMTRREITEKYDFINVYSEKSIKIVMTGIHYALKDLIPDRQERIDLEKRIREKAGKERFENGNGVGAFNPKKQKRSGQNSALKRGHIPWSHDEKMTLVELANDSAYQHQEGYLAGKPDYRLIQVRLQQLYGVLRTVNTIGHRLSELRKKNT